MVEARGESRLHEQPLARSLVLDDSCGEHLQRNGPIEADVECPVDLSHAAPPDQLLGQIARELWRGQRIIVFHRGPSRKPARRFVHLQAKRRAGAKKSPGPPPSSTGWTAAGTSHRRRSSGPR